MLLYWLIEMLYAVLGRIDRRKQNVCCTVRCIVVFTLTGFRVSNALRIVVSFDPNKMVTNGPIGRRIYHFQSNLNHALNPPMPSEAHAPGWLRDT